MVKEKLYSTGEDMPSSGVKEAQTRVKGLPCQQVITRNITFSATVSKTSFRYTQREPREIIGTLINRSKTVPTLSPRYKVRETRTSLKIVAALIVLRAYFGNALFSTANLTSGASELRHSSYEYIRYTTIIYQSYFTPI